MTKTIIKLMITLIQNMSVVILLAYILTRTKWFSDILNKKFNSKNQFFLVIIFGIFSIYGTLSGMELFGAIANIRNLGPLIAGLLGGPLIGLGAGMIGAVHRFTLGGMTCIPCSLMTVFAGLFGGAIFTLRKGKFVGVFAAVVIAIITESFHMWLNLITVKPYDKVLEIVKNLAIPMIVANSFGLGAFAFIVSNLIKERETESIKETIESELKIAREIQLSIVPKIFPPFPDRPEFDVYAVLHPAKEVGGDLYDFFLIDDEHICFTIGDVSGKGVPASLFMAVTKTLIKAKTEKITPPDEILFKVNNELYQENDSMMFVTVFVGILNIKTGEVVYSNGGHNSPYLIRKNGDIKMLEKVGGRLLGISENAPYKKNSFTLQSGDLLFLYTDGVTEAMDVNEKLFSEKKLEETLKRIYHQSPQDITQGVLSEIEKFANGANQSDDITIMILKYNISHNKEYVFELKNTLKEIECLSLNIQEFCKNHSVSQKTIYDITLSLEELVTNIISYGYDDKNEHKIEIKFILQDDVIEITIKDDAKPFDPTKHPEPDVNKSLEEKQIGGLGIHLVRNLMNTMSYKRDNGNNILTLTKKIK